MLLLLRGCSDNDTEIAIFGGHSGVYFSAYLSEVVLFNTKKRVDKMTDGGDFKFHAKENQCVQAGKNKIFAFS